MKTFFQTPLGAMMCADSRDVMAGMAAASVDLIVTSPPFALIVPKEYGNPESANYLGWFRSFAAQFHRILKPTGSLCIDIAGGWTPGEPTRTLYHVELPLMLRDEFGFHVAQEMYWHSPTRLPSAYWTCLPRVRLKDTVNCLWWLSPTPWPKASNRRVRVPYSSGMRRQLQKGRKNRGPSPSGHRISRHMDGSDNGGAIASNLLVLASSEANAGYLKRCRLAGIKPHPARFPVELPEFFIRMCTDPGDVVFDPFAGSCVTAEAAERLGRRWLCVEMREEYLRGARLRFSGPLRQRSAPRRGYTLPHPATLWADGLSEPEAELLPADGGRGYVRGRAEEAGG